MMSEVHFVTVAGVGIGGLFILTQSRAIRHIRNTVFPLTVLLVLYRNFIKPQPPSSSLLGDAFNLFSLAYTILNEQIFTFLGLPSLITIKLNSLILDIAGILLVHKFITTLQAIRRTTFTELKESFISETFFQLKKLPFVQKELQKEEDKMVLDLNRDLKDADRTITRSLPSKGLEPSAILKDIKARAKIENVKWQDGLVSGAVYCGEKEHTEMLSEVYKAFSLSNPLHPDIWPSVNQFEAEVCSMTASMLDGGVSSVVGCVSSGGTESIILAAKAHREFFGLRKGVKHFEIVSCVSAHAAIDKACELLSCRNVKVGTDPKTFKLDVGAMARAITADTIMLYASAPSFPQGVIDDIEALSKLALKHNIGLHVDCCLGGFVLPFAQKMGYELGGEFDFRLPGVTSMSVDTHKYGYAAKGTSVILYRNKELRRAQYFCYPKWTGGLYVTPTIAGSRPGALSAACWASLMAMGEDGYNDRVQAIMDCTQVIADAVRSIDGLYLLGDPRSMIVCFGSKKFNIYRVGDKMSKDKNWSLNTLQNPSCIHLCVTCRTVDNMVDFINDLEACVGEVIAEGNDGPLTGNAAIYGMSGSMPPGPVSELLCCYSDVMLTC